jgi:uncharacterized membrane protein
MCEENLDMSGEWMKRERLWEVDSLRGIAVVLMMIFNYSFALSFLDIYTVNGGFYYWYVFPRFVGAMFVSISGLSLTLFYGRIENKKDVHKKFFFRGVKIFGLGLLITIVTFLVFPDSFIVFGVLHLIGFSIIFGQFFVKFERLNLLLGIVIIASGIYLQNFTFDFSWFLWLGFIPKNFFTLDYFPIMPWFGFSLLGISFGNILYSNIERKFKIRDFSNAFIVKVLSFLGRNSLVVYLLHQPLLMLILLILGFSIF